MAFKLYYLKSSSSSDYKSFEFLCIASLAENLFMALGAGVSICTERIDEGMEWKADKEGGFMIKDQVQFLI